MQRTATTTWLKALGYAEAGAALHLAGEQIDARHPYAPEIREILDPKGLIQATAVFDVDDVPTVCFLAAQADAEHEKMDSIRNKIWNQNLISIVLLLDQTEARPLPILKDVEPGSPLLLKDATCEGPLSPADIQSGCIYREHPTWFNPEARVDRELLGNLGTAVKLLISKGLVKEQAQFLMGQTLFVSYLEHRDIVGDTYRDRRKVGALHSLVRNHDRQGLARLFKQLKKDFNGDFLDPRVSTRVGWEQLPDSALCLLDQFLSRTVLSSGQTSLWNYDFRYIPVELLSGIYETFLNEEQGRLGAYYTPRHLANLVVQQVLANSPNPSAERVYDGACGSGILLTTAFRRMLSHAEFSNGTSLDLRSRIELLTQGIFGSDLSEAACRVTTFSLYLSLLENLVPKDIAALTDDENVKLPTLMGKNIRYGEKEGDFFSPNNPHASGNKFTVFLSNPPWREADGSEKDPSFERWATKEKKTLVRRQIAGAFAYHALNCVEPNGTLCLILPASLLLAPTSQPFLQHWLCLVSVERIINFSDIRRLLFPTAKHGCVVVVAKPRISTDRIRIPLQEIIEYWVPKADISLAFSRLTVHANDRHKVQTQQLWHDNSLLREFTWGTLNDRALIARLVAHGTLDELIKHSEGGWSIIKGFNKSRRTSSPLSVAPLKKYRFLDTNRIPKDLPILDPELLETFPKEITSVVSYGSHDGLAFKAGPRVLFPDGVSNLLGVRSVFTTEPFCFKHTIAAIRGPREDEDVVRFLSVYLRSDLVSYFLLHTAFSPAGGRERITVKEVSNLPFCHPDDHHSPEIAWDIVREVANKLRELEAMDVFERSSAIDEASKRFHLLINNYFGLGKTDTNLVEDVVRLALPSRQPSTFAKIDTAWQRTPNQKALHRYASALLGEFIRWRDTLGGTGTFRVHTMATPPTMAGAWGIVRITVDAAGEIPDQKTFERTENRVLLAVIGKLKKLGLLPMALSENLYFAADCLIQDNDSIYILKPLVNRLWYCGQALEDARRIVESVQSRHSALEPA